LAPEMHLDAAIDQYPGALVTRAPRSPTTNTQWLPTCNSPVMRVAAERGYCCDVHCQNERCMMSTMETAVLIALLAWTGCASVGQPLAGKQDSKRYELKDGSVLIVDANGRMRMFNVDAGPISVRIGECGRSESCCCSIVRWPLQPVRLWSHRESRAKAEWTTSAD
jgi:hypothetical protein